MPRSPIFLIILLPLIALCQTPSSDRLLLDASSSDRSPLATQIVPKLLAQGASLESADPLTGDTPLIRAAASGNLEFVRALLASGARVNAKNKSGSTALQAATRAGAFETVELLRNSGAEVRYRDPVRVDEAVQLSRLRRQTAPVLPAEADTAPPQPVRFEAVIARSGAVKQLVFSDGPAALREEAAKAVMQWQFDPPSLDGESIEVSTLLHVYFLERKRPSRGSAGLGEITRRLELARTLDVRKQGLPFLEEAFRACASVTFPDPTCADVNEWYGLALQVNDNLPTVRKVEPLYAKALDLRAHTPHSASSFALSLELEARTLQLLGEVERARQMFGLARELREQSVASMNAPVTTGGSGQTPAASGVFKVGGGVSPPRVLSKIDPDYSEPARLLKITGQALVSLVIGKTGRAHSFMILKNIGFGLDEQAAAAVQSWVFEPGTRNGEPVNVRAQVEVNFKLR